MIENKLTRRDFLKTVGFSGAALSSGFAWQLIVAADGKSPDHVKKLRPNIVMILTDDQGWGDLSVSGNINLQTPNINSLCREGVSLEHFYVCAVCSPTRAEMLTGRYNTRLGVTGTSRGGERLNEDESTIGDTFKAAGYATAAFGKWHNGTQWPYHPNARGFDEFYGFCSGHWGHYFSPELEHNGQLVKGNGYITDDFTNHAIDFIEKNKNKPFFCYLPYNTPHSPMQVPDTFWKKFDEKELEMLHRDQHGAEVLGGNAAAGDAFDTGDAPGDAHHPGFVHVVETFPLQFDGFTHPNRQIVRQALADDHRFRIGQDRRQGIRTTGGEFHHLIEGHLGEIA